MAIQTAIDVGLLYAKEQTQGVLAPGARLREMPRVSGIITLEKDSYTSARVRRDRQKMYSRHGARRATGQLRDELSIGTSDEFLEGAVANSWALGSLLNKTGTYSIAVDGTITGTAGAFTGLFSGLTVSIEGFEDQEEGADAIIAKIVDVAADGSSITVTKRDEDAGAFVVEAGATASVDVVGRTLKNGRAKISYHFESYFPDIDSAKKYLVSTGVMIDSAAIDLPTSGLATINYTVRGLNQVTSATTADASPLSPIPGSLLAAVNGSCRVDGEKVALLTALSLNIANGLSGEAVVGSNILPQLYNGAFAFTGSFTAYLDSMQFVEMFDEEREMSLDTDLLGDDQLAFLSVILPRVKISSASVTADGTGGATVTCNFEALGSEEVGSTVVFQSSYIPA